MPYIDFNNRQKFLLNNDTDVDGNVDCTDVVKFLADKCETAGDLNYLFTRLAHNYLKNKGLNYQHINDIIGALEGCKLELYRRVAANYEDEKIILNGDVKEI